MKAVALTILVALAVGTETLENGMKVKFGMGTEPAEGREYFFNVPQNISAAKKDGWSITCRPSGPMPELVMYCPSDKVLCALYDDIGDIAGLQIALDSSSITNNVFDWKTRGFTLWHTDIDGERKTMWTIHQYFVSAESLKRSKKERLASRNPTRVLKENAIWVDGNYGKLVKISSRETDIVNQNIFKKQACIRWMGQHYYYNMSSTTPCDAENMYPWFPLTLNNELIAVGFLTFGRLSVRTGGRNWFENPSVDAVKVIVPQGPKCFYDLIKNFGATTMHIFYTSTPWLITC